MKKIRFSAFLLAALACASAPVYGSTQFVHTGFDLDRTIGLVFEVDGEQYVSAAGIGLVSIDNADPIASVCVNLFEGFGYFEEYQATIITPSAYSPQGGDAAAWILQTFLPGAQTAADGAALQLAIWDAIHDGGDGFEAGRIRSSSYTDEDVLRLASDWVARSTGMHGDRAYVLVPTENSPSFQQQMYLGATAYPSESESGCGDVPEPGTLAMLVAGIMGLLAAGRSR